MSIGRSVKAVLGGIVAFAVFAVLGEMTLRVIARLVARWSEAGVPLSGWHLAVADVGLFVARYFILALPVLLAVCVGTALLLSWKFSKHVAA